MDNSTAWKLSLENICLPSEIDKLHDFEAELENRLGLLQDDMYMLLVYGKFPENEKAPGNKVNCHNVP